MIRSFCFLFFLLLGVNHFAFCQPLSSVTGIVMEQSVKAPLEFVDVLLINATSKTFVQGTTTNASGRFRLSQIPPGSYFLRLNLIGFENKETPPFTITGQNGELDLGAIPIAVSHTLLEEVEVTAEKQTYNLALDRKIYNVKKDILSQASSAAEILQNIPSVTVDVDGQVSLRGTSNITYFINGRPSALLRASGSAALQQIPASTIERIEVITNPSAKYRPDGIGGIINIVLKEDSREGWTGTLSGNVGNLSRQNAALSLAFGSDGINIFGSYGFRHANTPRTEREVRIDKDENGAPVYSAENNSTRETDEYSHVVSTGADIAIGESSQLDIAGTYYFGKEDKNTVTDWEVEEEARSVFSIDRTLEELEKEVELSAAFEHEFDDDHTLAIELAYSAYDEKEDNFYNENHILPTGFGSRSHNLIEKGGPLTELSVEYARPLGEDSQLEAGYLTEFMKDDIQFLVEELNAQDNSWAADHNKTNHFVFHQNLHALYTTFGHSMDAFSFLAGLRAEQTFITSRLITTGEEAPNSYFQLFPTLHLSYELGGGQELQLSYGRRINRADSDEHNPFAEYDDPRNREVGNPKLLPEQVHSLELGYHLQKENFSFLPNLYYRYKYNAFTEIKEIVEDSILQSRQINLADETSAGLELILTGNIGKFLRLIFSANAFYNELDASNLDFTEKRSNITWNSKLAANLDVTPSTFAQVNAYYRSSRLSAQGESKPLFLLNLGVRQDIFQNRASLTLTVSDVFASLQWEKIIDMPELYQKRNYTRNKQIVYLGFQYRFGQAFKKDKEKLDFVDEI
ncbi:MAG: TonB-dependent receptor [Lewinellaceae bacterium]|nr:TonB-dependent receptor [Lewinellaceae bacterium]